jgi:hypothetical protein
MMSCHPVLDSFAIVIEPNDLSVVTLYTATTD